MRGYDVANLKKYSIKKRKPVGTDKGEIFESVTQAAKEINCYKSGIFGCLAGRYKTCKGRQWFYLDLNI